MAVASTRVERGRTRFEFEFMWRQRGLIFTRVEALEFWV